MGPRDFQAQLGLAPHIEHGRLCCNAAKARAPTLVIPGSTFPSPLEGEGFPPRSCEASRMAGRVRGDSFLTRLPRSRVRRLPLTASARRSRALPQGESGETVVPLRPNMRTRYRDGDPPGLCSFSPQATRGMARRKTLTFNGTRFDESARRLSARHSGVFIDAGPRFPVRESRSNRPAAGSATKSRSNRPKAGRATPRSSACSRQGLVMVPGGAPTPPG